MPPTKNTLYYGDNLPILRQHILDNSVDLVYLDPPFNSNRNYNVLFKTEKGVDSEAQVQAFVDTWHWNAAAAAQYNQLVTGPGIITGRIYLTEASYRRFVALANSGEYAVGIEAEEHVGWTLRRKAA